MAQHHAALPGVFTLVGIYRLRVKAVVGIQLKIQRADLHAVHFGGNSVVAFITSAGAAGTGDTRRVALIVHYFRTTGLHRCHCRDVKLHAADVEVLHPCALAVVVHPEVVVDTLLRTLVEVTACPQVGVGVGCQNIGHPGIGFFQVHLVAPVIEHHVDVPDSAVIAFKRFRELEFTAVALVAQTANGGGAVIGSVNANELLIAALELRPVAGIAGKLHAKGNGHIWRLGHGLRLGNDIGFLIDRRIHFFLPLRESFIHCFCHNRVDLFLSKLLGAD